MKISTIKNYIKVVLNERNIVQLKKDNLYFLSAELLRNTHSIEKGLSIEKPRLGFGHQKQKEMMEQIRILRNSNTNLYNEICDMAISALKTYSDFHQDNKYSDDVLDEINEFLLQFPVPDVKTGGTISIDKTDLEFNEDIIKYFFQSRHSIREFDRNPVDADKLKKALSLAQTAPSACNRQGVRAYVLSHELSRNLSQHLSGIGGFADSVDRFIMITGKTSAYRKDEIDQYIVSASIFAAYLSLTLHLYSLGACIVQRPVIWSKNWEECQNRFSIPKDEQIVCLVAVGNLKEKFKVPVSHRISTNEIVHFIE